MTDPDDHVPVPRPLDDLDAEVDDRDLDEMDEAALDAALAADDDVLGVSLRTLLEPSDDFERRTADVVDATLRGRSTLGLGLDLLGLGWHTLTTMLSDDALRADGVDEGNHDGT